MGKSNDKTQPADSDNAAMKAALMAFNPVGMAAWMNIVTESARFVADRLEQDVAAQQAMLNCKTPADLLRVQTEFYQKAIEQYTAEATHMIDMMSKAAVQSIEEARAPHARGYDDVPL